MLTAAIASISLYTLVTPRPGNAYHRRRTARGVPGRPQGGSQRPSILIGFTGSHLSPSAEALDRSSRKEIAIVLPPGMLLVGALIAGASGPSGTWIGQDGHDVVGP